MLLKMTEMRALPWLVGLVWFALSNVAFAAPALSPHIAEYKIKISVLGGKLRTQLQETDNGYRADSSIRATGMSRLIARGAIQENSLFTESPQGLRPDVFQSDDTMSRGGETVDFKFDWEQREITGTLNGEEFQTGIDGVIHDRVSLQYALMHDLLNGIHRNSYLLQDAEKLKPLSVTNIGSKQVKVPFGKFEAIGIQHRSEGSSRVTTLWCVEELGYLPVIIEQHRKGKLQVRAMLTNYTPQD
jgi:hypothetical protein